MGQVDALTFDQVVAKLRRENPRGKQDEIAMYARAFVQYREAEANIQQYGSIVAHPRTGAPTDNPYLKVQAASMRSLRSFRRLKTASLWK